MIHAYHLIMVTYGSRLPNDQRGSWSDFVASWELYKKRKSSTRGEMPPSLHDRPELSKRRRDVQQALKLPPVVLDGIQARAVGGGFAEQVRKSKLIVWACSILPEHVHLVISRGRLPIERTSNLLKGEATKQLKREEIHPLAKFAGPGESPRSPWARKGWKVYLDNEESIENAIRYVEENPINEGKPFQHWSFVEPFSGLDGGCESFL